MKKYLPCIIAIPFLVLVACDPASRFGLPPPSAQEQGIPEPQEVQIPETTLPPLTGLKWVLPEKYATLEGNKLIVDIPASDYPADAMAEAELPASLYAGSKGFSMTVFAEGTALAKPTKTYLGLKFQMHLVEKATGMERWPNCPREFDDFSKVLRNDATFGGLRPDSVTLQLGLQGTSGRVVFDLSTLCGGPTPGLFRLINQDWIVRYPKLSASNSERETSDPSCQSLVTRSSSLVTASKRRMPLRGFMLPQRATTEDDIETMHSWGATMARFQITRNWSGTDDNQDLEEYAAWVDSRLDNLEDVLRWADARGMKIVIDVHVPPGGKRAKDREMNMLHNDVFAEAWIDTWRRIATRFKGKPAIYGYDLINEPHHNGRVKNDYWTLQRRAAEVVRAIDPDTPIIIESNGSDAPSTFEYLSPLRMNNVIYQVHVYGPTEFTHQGIQGKPAGLKWPDPEKKWDKDHLRTRLAPVRAFEARHHAKIYVGEFSAITWAEGAENYLRDCIELFEEYGWDWTYHAFREANVWSIEHTIPAPGQKAVPSADNPRKRAILAGLRPSAE